MNGLHIYYLWNKTVWIVSQEIILTNINYLCSWKSHSKLLERNVLRQYFWVFSKLLIIRELFPKLTQNIFKKNLKFKKKYGIFLNYKLKFKKNRLKIECFTNKVECITIFVFLFKILERSTLFLGRNLKHNVPSFSVKISP